MVAGWRAGPGGTAGVVRPILGTGASQPAPPSPRRPARRPAPFLSSAHPGPHPMSTDTPTASPATEAATEAATQHSAENADPRALTVENVERVLDELRPYLMADGGNVEIVEIDGPVVKVRLQGACGSCPSSTMTLKMGIERKLREAIPEVSEVVQVL